MLAIVDVLVDGIFGKHGGPGSPSMIWHANCLSWETCSTCRKMNISVVAKIREEVVTYLRKLKDDRTARMRTRAIISSYQSVPLLAHSCLLLLAKLNINHSGTNIDRSSLTM